MPKKILSISHIEATKIVSTILEKAGSDGGEPVAVAVVDYAGRLTAFTAMDNGMPAGAKLSQSKAYSAIIGKRDTVQWASIKKNTEFIDFDMRNWTDENFTCFTGGVLIYHDQQIIGAVGVSGRKGKQDDTDVLMQDNELAEYGRSVLNF
jgi:glc operon protein GlcG